MLTKNSHFVPHLSNLSIKGFRGIADLTLPTLGHVNLITGKNNVGKTSILEGLRIFTQNASPPIVREILRYREEDFRSRNDEERFEEWEGTFPLSPLFIGFPKFPGEHDNVVISSGDKDSIQKVSLFVDSVSAEALAPNVRNTQRLTQQSLFEFFEDIPALVVETEDGKDYYRLEDFLRPTRVPRLLRERRIRNPHQFVSSHGTGRTAHLGSLWDEAVYQGVEEYVLGALHIIEPRITAFFMLGDDSPGRSRTAIVRADYLGGSVPLRSLGDGINRVAVIILSLINARGGLLLVDEFENGLHHTVQLDAWRMIFRLAKELKVQVFATSHSLEAVAAFQRAAAETPEDGVLIRLSHWGDEVVSASLDESELRTAVEYSIEMR